MLIRVCRPRTSMTRSTLSTGQAWSTRRTRENHLVTKPHNALVHTRRHITDALEREDNGHASVRTGRHLAHLVEYSTQGVNVVLRRVDENLSTFPPRRVVGHQRSGSIEPE